MIVVDASVMIEMLLRSRAGEAVAARFASAAEDLHAPHLIDVEVAQTMRRLVLGRRIAARTGGEALLDLSVFPLTRYPHGQLVQDGWALRDNVSAYDAVYVALAQALAAPLITRDQRLAVAVAGRIAVDVV